MEMKSITILHGSTPCDICYKTFDGPLAVELHKSTEHKETLQCSSCNLNFANVYALKRHIEVSGDVCDLRMKPCTKCGEIFATNKLLSQHMQEVHETKIRKRRSKQNSKPPKKQNKRCTCSGRKQAGTDVSDKTVELTDPLGEIVERTDPFGEIVERTSLSDHDYAKSHENSERSSPSAFERKTPVTFETETVMLSPSWSYIGETVEVYSYEENLEPKSELFDLESSDIKEEPDDDQNQEDFEVERTERTWPPVRITHEPSCPYSKKNRQSKPKVKCELCDLSFVSLAVLRYHQRIHTGEKPFQCSYCEKRFRIKQQLVVHTRVHTGERPYKCPHCDKAFTTLPNIHRHQLVHTKERPHSCPICGNFFQQSNSVKLHIQTVHFRIPAKPRNRVRKIKTE